jgi:hypothetical protein
VGIACGPQSISTALAWFIRMVADDLSEHIEKGYCVLRTKGYIPTHFDPCIFILTTGPQFLAIYIDNISIYGPADSTMDYIKRALKSEFEVTDLGDIH